MKCKHHTENKSLFFYKTNGYVSEVYIELDGSLTVTVPSYGEDIDNSINFKINYCPMCGEKLQGNTIPSNQK